MSKKQIIPLLDLKKEYLFLKKDINRQIKDCLDSQQWVLGGKVSQFEKVAAKYLGVKYAVGVASGTDALILSLSALALKLKNKPYFEKKDEIITTPFTFIATAESILRAGATPVFVDINPYTFNIDHQAIKKAINKNTVGILPVHLYGLPSEMGNIQKLAKENKLFVVEDLAQSFGADYKNKKTGSLGDLGACSFFPSKNLGSFGDAGLIITNSLRFDQDLRLLRSHGQESLYDAKYLGYNSRLDSIQASVLLSKIKHIDKFNDLRIKVAKQYNEGFKSIKEVVIPYSFSDAKHIYHLYTLKVLKNRDKFLNYLNSKGVTSRVYYPVLLSEMKAFKAAKVKGSLKCAKSTKSKVISIPIYPFLNQSQIDYIIKQILSFF